MFSIISSSSEIFIIRTVVITKLLVSGFLFSTSLISVFKTVVIPKPLVSGIFFLNISNFSLQICLSEFYWFMWSKVAAKVAMSFLVANSDVSMSVAKSDSLLVS